MASAGGISRATLGGLSNENKQINVDSILFNAETPQITEFMTSFQWLEQDYGPKERPTDIGLQIEFLKNKNNGIKAWLVIAPQRKESFGEPLKFKALPDLAIKSRKRMEGRGFQQFGEPDIRALAEYLAGLDRPDKKHITTPGSETAKLKDKKCGILLIYPVRENEKDPVSIGFEILYPENDLGYAMHFRTQDRSGRVVVSTPK